MPFSTKFPIPSALWAQGLLCSAPPPLRIMKSPPPGKKGRTLISLNLLQREGPRIMGVPLGGLEGEVPDAHAQLWAIADVTWSP